ncbi:MAG: GNAT family N-acetyltransferase [Ferruginibacter sp.]
MHIIFETPRLYLRRFTLDDAPLIYNLNSKPEVLQYLHEPLVRDEAHAREVLSNITLPQYELNLGRWAAFIKDSNTFIGWCGLKYLAERNETDLGYRFLPEQWGKGYATEAASHTLDYGFDQLHLNAITGMAHIENIASLNVLQKIGMQYVKNDVVDNCPVKTYIKINPNQQ